MADRGRKAKPCGNYLVQTRFDEYCMRIHHSRLNKMARTPVRCQSMDNSMPASMLLSHLKTRGKKRQMEKEWKQRVERDNLTLLAKMERIMHRTMDDISKPATFRTSMASATKQSGVALDPTQYPYVDCILKEPHAPIRKGKGHERALAAKQVIAENHKMLYRIRDARPIITQDEHVMFEEAQGRYSRIARKPEISRLAHDLPRQTAPRNSLMLAAAQSSLDINASMTGTAKSAATLNGRPEFDSTPFIAQARPKTSSVALVPTSQLHGSRSQPVAAGRPATVLDETAYARRLDLMYNTGRPFGFRPDSYAAGPTKLNTKVTEASLPAFPSPKQSPTQAMASVSPGDRARAAALRASLSSAAAASPAPAPQDTRPGDSAPALPTPVAQKPAREVEKKVSKSPSKGRSRGKGGEATVEASPLPDKAAGEPAGQAPDMAADLTKADKPETKKVTQTADPAAEETTEAPSEPPADPPQTAALEAEPNSGEATEGAGEADAPADEGVAAAQEDPSGGMDPAPTEGGVEAAEA